MCEMGGWLYVCAGDGDGHDALSQCERYSITSNEWQPVSLLKQPRAFHGLVAVGEQILAIGGSQSDMIVPGEDGGIISESVECYDRTTYRWKYCAPMPVPVWQVECAVLGGSVWVLGGKVDGDTPLPYLLEYNVKSNVWRQHKDIPLYKKKYTDKLVVNCSVPL